MSDPTTVDFVATAVFFLFTAMLIAAFFSVTARVARWRVRRIAAPVLLIRDLITVGGLSFSFLAIAVARVIELPPVYTRTVAWIVFTSTPGLIGMGVFLYFEFFVIGHGED